LYQPADLQNSSPPKFWNRSWPPRWTMIVSSLRRCSSPWAPISSWASFRQDAYSHRI